MKYTVSELALARQDKESIVRWIKSFSLDGARLWLDSYDNAIATLASIADIFPIVPESERFEIDIRQILFKTRHGRSYRVIFHIQDEHVYVIRVRGPGQAPMKASDLGP